MKNNSIKMLGCSLLVACLAFGSIGSSAVCCEAANATLYSKFAELKVGAANEMYIDNYIFDEDVLAGCFTAPSTGEYSFSVVNTGELSQRVYMRDNDFADIDNYDLYDSGDYYNFENKEMKLGEKAYFCIDEYVNSSSVDGKKKLASKVVISKVDKTPAKIQVNNSSSVKKTTSKAASTANTAAISKTSCKLKKGKKLKLRIKNNTKKVIWISEKKKVASVNSKGVVKAKKKGTTYIYAIANHKLYQCKIKVY